MDYEEQSLTRVLYVSIKQLIRSDSGRYRCGLSKSSTSSYREFDVVVAEGEFLLKSWKCATQSSVFTDN